MTEKNNKMKADNPTSPPLYLQCAALGNFLILLLAGMYLLWIHANAVEQHIPDIINPFAHPLGPLGLRMTLILLLSALVLTFIPPLFEWTEIRAWLSRDLKTLPPEPEGGIGGEIALGLYMTLGWGGLALFLLATAHNPNLAAAKFNLETEPSLQILAGLLALGLAILFPLYALYPGNKQFRHRLAELWREDPAAAPPAGRQNPAPGCCCR